MFNIINGTWYYNNRSRIKWNFNDTTLFKTIVPPSLYSVIYFLIYPLMSKTQHIIRLK